MRAASQSYSYDPHLDGEQTNTQTGFKGQKTEAQTWPAIIWMAVFLVITMAGGPQVHV